MELYQIIIGIIIAVSLSLAVAAFIRTPPSERWTPSKPINKPGVSYAPMFSKDERIRIVLKNALWLAPLFLALKFWFFPYLAEYSKNANCYNYGPINGSHLIFYGIFVGMPLGFALMFYLLEGVKAIAAYKASQYPPPNQKVFAVTEYKYGNAAKRKSILSFAFIMFFVGLAIWGGTQAHELTKIIKPCAANKQLNPDAAKSAAPVN